MVPDDAYRFARGQEITSSTGIPVKLPRPLDWMVLTDHTDLMGFAADIQSGTPNIVASANGKEWHEGFVNGGKETGAAAFDLISHFAQMKLPAELVADYENRDVGNLDISQLKKPVMLRGDYAREALKQGLALAAKLGYDPYKFGFGGATDSHTSLATADEDNFFGKSSSVESSADRISHPFVSSEIGTFEGYTLVAFGYTGIWAHENTRGALFDAMERRETYGTTGPRMTVRFFSGWDFSKKDLHANNAALLGYEKGVPMGGDLKKVDGKKAPSFLVSALRDPQSANLDRIQVVKGWMDEKGELHERSRIRGTGESLYLAHWVFA